MKRLDPAQIAAAHQDLGPTWTLAPGPDRLERRISAARYVQIAEALAQMADEADHHPTVQVHGDTVTLSWWTHDLGGLQARDFTMAARTNALIGED